MSKIPLAISFACAALLAACASKQPTQTPQSTQQNVSASANASQTTKSRDGSYSGEVVGTPQPGSKFAKLQIGMQMGEVQDAMGRAPDRFHSYESGKRWIPFYFGNDARRMQVLYKGEGCLVFTGGGVFGGSGGDLIGINHDPAGNCYQP